MRVRRLIAEGAGRIASFFPRSRFSVPAQAAAFAVPAAVVLFAFSSGSRTDLECGGPEVKQAIVGLFKRQLKLTPYARFIDVANADVNIEAVFDVAASADAHGGVGPQETTVPVANANAKTCVAFATYDAKLNDAGERVEGRDLLQSSLLRELSGEKQIFYTVKLTTERRKNVRVNRITG